MLLTINKWGNSLGIRIPKEIKETLGIQSGSEVIVEYDEDRIVLKPKRQKSAIQKVNIKEMVSRITKENKHAEFSDKPVGKEIW